MEEESRPADAVPPGTLPALSGGGDAQEDPAPDSIDALTPAPETPPKPIEFNDEVVVLSSFSRATLWVLVLLLVLSNATLCTIFAVVYAQNSKRDSLLWLFRIFFLFSDGNKFLQESSRAVATGYAVLAAVFFGFALHIITLSIRTRSIRFGAAAIKIPRTLTRSGSTFHSFKNTRLGRLKARLVEWNRLVGVRGPYFDVRLLLDEVFELSTQTAAAYTSSLSISNVYLNQCYGVVIFCNSVSSVVYRFVFKNSLVKQRMACLLTDLVLDFIWGSLLPIWMYMPIVKTYLDRENIYDYIDSYANATREVERVLVLSWKAYALSIIPFCNALFNLSEIQSIMREVTVAPRTDSRSSSTAGSRTESASPASPSKVVDKAAAKYAAAALSADKAAPVEAKAVLKLRYRTERLKHGKLSHFAHAIITLYGIGVLFTSLAANGAFGRAKSYTEFDCLHRVNPWFTRKEACIGRRVNCTRAGITGSKAELETVLDIFDEGSLGDLFLTSCSKIEMPSQIQSFSRLQSLVIQGSTINEWSAAAALDAEHFDGLRTVNLNGITLTGELDGIVTSPLSKSVEWIHLENLDGTRVLSKVGKNWESLLFFDCMSCGLTEFPDAVTHMYRLLMMSLSVNDLTNLPDWPSALDLHMQALWMSYNGNLTTLPDGVWRQAASLGIFSLHHTNLSAIPEWLPEVAGPEFALNAIATPLCSGNITLSDAIKPLVSCGGGD